LDSAESRARKAHSSGDATSSSTEIRPPRSFVPDPIRCDASLCQRCEGMNAVYVPTSLPKLRLYSARHSRDTKAIFCTLFRFVIIIISRARSFADQQASKREYELPLKRRQRWPRNSRLAKHRSKMVLERFEVDLFITHSTVCVL
jgi:hypothetical protein